MIINQTKVSSLRRIYNQAKFSLASRRYHVDSSPTLSRIPESCRTFSFAAAISSLANHSKPQSPLATTDDGCKDVFCIAVEGIFIDGSAQYRSSGTQSRTQFFASITVLPVIKCGSSRCSPPTDGHAEFSVGISGAGCPVNVRLPLPARGIESRFAARLPCLPLFVRQPPRTVAIAVSDIARTPAHHRFKSADRLHPQIRQVISINLSAA